MSPWFNWTTDALSDLGHPRHASAATFGAALLAAGLLYLDAVWALRPLLPKERLSEAAFLSLAFGALSLSGIGVINVSFGAPHFVVSLTYFTFVPLGMALLAAIYWTAHRRFALATIAMASAAAAFGISILTAIGYGAPFPSQAIPELIASAILAAWALLVGVLLWTGTFPRP